MLIYRKTIPATEIEGGSFSVTVTEGSLYGCIITNDEIHEFMPEAGQFSLVPTASQRIG